MKNGVVVFLSILILTSCKTDSTENAGNESQEVIELKNEIAQLKLDKELQDSVIQEALAFFNEIQLNLESIGIKKDAIKNMTTDPEFGADRKQLILEEIRHINFLREENGRKVKQLNQQLKDSGVKLAELDAMITRLVNDIKVRDEQIAMLQSEMDQMDQEYSKLFDAYQAINLQIDNIMDEANTVYYSYGTTKELISNKVLEQKNGFIGIGKTVSLKHDFNEKYFSKIDLTRDKSIFIEGSTPRLITDHPTGSYSIVPDGKNSKIVINSPREFWKISRYLVVVVD